MHAQRIASASLAGTSGRTVVCQARSNRVASRLKLLPSFAPINHVSHRKESCTAPAAAAAPGPQANESEAEYAARRVEERRHQKQREQLTYQVSAVASTLGMISLAIVATYLRFSWHHDAGEFPWAEFAATLLLVAGGVIGMEMWARYAHKALWHDFQPGWKLHKSHHVPRVGPFEDNDVFAIINAVPAMSLCAFGFFTPTMLGGLCFGAGLGITLFGIMYMFIHDGLVHNRFPVGPVGNVPYLQRVALAHTMHHAAKWGGKPWGLFLGPQELIGVPGAVEELDRLVTEAKAKALQQTQAASQ